MGSRDDLKADLEPALASSFDRPKSRASSRIVPEYERDMTAPRTLYDKIWDDHVVETVPRTGARRSSTSTCHLIHEVTSPQAFDGTPA